MLIWIGTAILDRLFSYPERHNLSSSCFPIHLLQPVLAKALRALDALPDAPTDLAREAGAALSAIVSRRANGFCPTSG